MRNTTLVILVWVSARNGKYIPAVGGGGGGVVVYIVSPKIKWVIYASQPTTRPGLEHVCTQIKNISAVKYLELQGGIDYLPEVWKNCKKGTGKKKRIFVVGLQ